MTVNWYKDNPVVMFEFEVVNESYEVELPKSIDSELKDKGNIHLEIIGDEKVSFIAANEVVEWFEHELPDAKIDWNITQSTRIKEGSIIVCCVYLD